MPFGGRGGSGSPATLLPPIFTRSGFAMPGLCEPGCREPTGYGQQGSVCASQGAQQIHGRFTASQIGLVHSAPGLSKDGHLLLRSGVASLSGSLSRFVVSGAERGGSGHWTTPGLYLFFSDLQRPSRAKLSLGLYRTFPLTHRTCVYEYS